MTATHLSRPAGRGGARHPGLRAVAAAGVLLALTAGCAHGQSAGAPAVAPASGHYAVVTAPARASEVPLASRGHYRLVSAGDTVRVKVGSAVVRATMTGPEIDQSGYVVGQPPPSSADGVVTVVLQAETGSLRVPASSFLTLGEHQDRIRVRADHARLDVAPGHPVTLRLATRFTAGHTTLTWQPQGTPLVTWDFVIELD